MEDAEDTVPKDVMDAWTNPKIRHVVMVAASQVGKSECMNNIIGYIMIRIPDRS